MSDASGAKPLLVFLNEVAGGRKLLQAVRERAEEAVAIFKTRVSLAEPLRQAVKEAHPYETPSIMVVPVESVDSDYYAWILKETER